MTYLITQKGDRWLIYSCGACILECKDEAVAIETVAAASLSLLNAPAARPQSAPISRWRSTAAPEATTIAARFG
jgi:hypothetical protein